MQSPRTTVTVACHGTSGAQSLGQIGRRSERIPTLKKPLHPNGLCGGSHEEVLHTMLATVVRNPDGSLPRMTPRQRQAAVKLIRSICSNYDNGNCLLLDNGEGCVCVQSISFSVNCKFFRHVLLEDKAGRSLKAEIFRDGTTKLCAVCGKTFQSTSNNAKYCGECKENVQRKQKAAHARKRRSTVEK